MPPKTQSALKLPGLQPGRQSCRVHVREEFVQAQIERALRSRGYWVLSTSEHRKREKCPHCDGWMTSKQGRGCDKGVPDLLVTTARHRAKQWPRGAWLGLECKGTKTALSPEQKVLEQENRIYVVRSVEAALAAVRDFELFLL